MNDSVVWDTGDTVEGRALVDSLARQGVHADAVIPAFQGLYPLFGGLTNFGMLLTRQRALSFHNDEMRIWGRFSGMQVTTPRGRYDRHQIRLTRAAFSYVQLVVDGGPKLWVYVTWADAIADWLKAEEPSS